MALTGDNLNSHFRRSAFQKPKVDLGKKYSETTGCFRASKVHRPLSGNKSEVMTVASRP